jgi:hypothetical protein
MVTPSLCDAIQCQAAEVADGGRRWRLPSSSAPWLDPVLSVLIPQARYEPAPDEKSAHKVHYSAFAFWGSWVIRMASERSGRAICRSP